MNARCTFARVRLRMARQEAFGVRGTFKASGIGSGYSSTLNDSVLRWRQNVLGNLARMLRLSRIFAFTGVSGDGDRERLVWRRSNAQKGVAALLGSSERKVTPAPAAGWSPARLLSRGLLCLDYSLLL